jgi:hypothetical protein
MKPLPAGVRLERLRESQPIEGVTGFDFVR